MLWQDSARCGEAALVWIRMAGCAFVERKAGVFHVGLGVLDRNVAFGASHGGMRPGEWVLGGGMIESWGGLPCARRMATLAVIAQLAAMLVCMAA